MGYQWRFVIDKGKGFVILDESGAEVASTYASRFARLICVLVNNHIVALEAIENSGINVNRALRDACDLGDQK